MGVGWRRVAAGALLPGTERPALTRTSEATMVKFLLGVLIGAAAVWIYQFFKGDDVSWEQPFTTSGVDSNAYSGATTTPASASSSEPSAVPD